MNRTVLVTGSSSGFGRRAAERFLRDGWNVAATLRDPAQWAGEPSDRLLVHAMDVRDQGSITAAIGATTERFGRLDVVVNNAGMGLFSVFEATPQELIEELFDTNVFGPMRLVRSALPVFHRQGGGRIVNVTSSGGTVPTPFQAGYAASKGALHNFSESLSYELDGLNVQVKVVEPGLVTSTGFFGATSKRFEATPTPAPYLPFLQKQVAAFDVVPPQGYLGTEGDVAAAIVAAATDESGTFRFRVGNDTADYAHARRQSDADYDAWRKAYFGLS